MKLSEIRRLKSVSGSQQLPSHQLVALMRAQGLDPDRLYQELEMDSRFINTHEDTSTSRDEVQLHSHTFYEALYIRGGNVQYLLGSRRYRLQRGDVVMITPGDSHRPLFLEPLTEPYRRYVLWMSPEFVDLACSSWPELLLSNTPSGVLRTAGTPWEALLREDFRRGCIEASRQAVGWQASVCGNTLQLLVHIKRAAADLTGRAPAAEKRELLDEVLAYIEDNLAEKITLEGTARRFLVSTSTVSQLFRNKLGVSFYRCVTQRRLIAAKGKILDGEPLESLCTQVGFGDYSTFYRAFKQEYGISPRQFRKMQEAPAEQADGQRP